MKILSLVKHVPESTARINVQPDGSGIDPKGVKFVMNPFCEFAVEAALQFKEKNSGAGAEITALTLGPDSSVDALRTAYAMGADNAIHLNDPSFEKADDLAVARIIAAAIKDGGYQVIFAGKHAIDYDRGQVGAALAECLGIPHVGAVTDIEWAADFKSATARRRVEGAEEIVEVQLPAVFTIEKGYVEARYPSLPGLMKAKKKPIDTKDAAALGLSADDVKGATEMYGFAPPPARPEGRKLEGEPEQQVAELVRILREEEKML
ncbi:MAG TPA: electron transfer flavoprotein subunit beta/FixA family protein [Phycisphaerae bacterium]|nr:electron transfer flavoprotein subunit beta/FixA family protein [Phycisphaerae bacterium]HRW54583.1 electron transfer flavoprotein subunit beta/FixA family protein [Phycisphaerae bacterium]